MPNVFAGMPNEGKVASAGGQGDLGPRAAAPAARVKQSFNETGGSRIARRFDLKQHSPQRGGAELFDRPVLLPWVSVSSIWAPVPR